MTLPAAAARAPAAIDQYAVPAAAVDQYLLPAPGCSMRRMSTDGTDKRTDGRIHDRYIDPAPHTTRVASTS